MMLYFITTGLWIVHLLLLCCSASAAGLELPEPPEGYSWRQVKDIKAAFLVPNAWEFDSEGSAGQHLYTITRKDGDPDKPGRAGLTIVVRQEIGTDILKGMVPSQFAKAIFDEIRKNRELEREQSALQGPFETIRYQYVTSPDSSTQLREYSLFVANDRTGTLYIFSFESPLSQWEDDWQKMTVVFDTIFLDDEI